MNMYLYLSDSSHRFIKMCQTQHKSSRNSKTWFYLLSSLLSLILTTPSVAVEYTGASPEKQAYLDVTDALRKGYAQFRSAPTEIRDEYQWDLHCGVNDVPDVRAYYESCHRAIEQHLTNNQALDLAHRLFAARALHGYLRAQSQLVASYWGTHEALMPRLRAYSQQLADGDVGDYTVYTCAGQTFNLFAPAPFPLLNEAHWFMNRVDRIIYEGAAYLPKQAYNWEIFALIAGEGPHTCGGQSLQLMVPVLELFQALGRGEEDDVLAGVSQAAHQHIRDRKPADYSNADFEPFTHVMHDGIRIEAGEVPAMVLQATHPLYPAPEACAILAPAQVAQALEGPVEKEEPRAEAVVQSKAHAKGGRVILPSLGLTGEETDLEGWAEGAMAALQADIHNPEAIMRVGEDSETFPENKKNRFKDMVNARVNRLAAIGAMPEFGRLNGPRNINILLTWLRDRDIADKEAVIRSLERLRDAKYTIDASHDPFLQGIFQVMRVVSWIEKQEANDQQKAEIGDLMFKTCDIISEQYRRCATGAKGRGFLLHHYLWQFLKAQSGGS